MVTPTETNYLWKPHHRLGTLTASVRGAGHSKTSVPGAHTIYSKINLKNTYKEYSQALH